MMADAPRTFESQPMAQHDRPMISKLLDCKFLQFYYQFRILCHTTTKKRRFRWPSKKNYGPRPVVVCF